MARRRTILAPLEEFSTMRPTIDGITYRAFERTPVDIVARELTDCHGSIFVGIHFDESEAAIGLEARLNNVPEVLEERNKVILGGVWC